MTASAVPKTIPPSSPKRQVGGNNNNSSQVSGAFGRCTEPVPANVASARKQQLAAQKTKSDITTPAGTKLQADDGYSGCQKTVASPRALKGFSKKAGSVPMPEVNIFSPPEPTVHKTRTTQHHTDPFSENRVRDEGNKRKNLVPESSTKAPKAQSVRVSAGTKAKWDTPYAADDNIDVNNMSAGSPTSPLSPTRSSTSYSPNQHGKKCLRTQETSDIFAAQPTSPLAMSATEQMEARSASTRFKHSSVGDTTMFNAPTEAELIKERTIHKKTIPQKQSMEGVFTPIQKKNRHPNYKFHAPFARQGSVAASVRVGGRRHPRQAAGVKEGEVVTPFASTSDEAQKAAPPAEFTGAKPKKVFNDKHSSKTPFARHNSGHISHRPSASKRFFNQAPTSPFATHENVDAKM